MNFFHHFATRVRFQVYRPGKHRRETSDPSCRRALSHKWDRRDPAEKRWTDLNWKGLHIKMCWCQLLQFCVTQSQMEQRAIAKKSGFLSQHETPPQLSIEQGGAGAVSLAFARHFHNQRYSPACQLHKAGPPDEGSLGRRARLHQSCQPPATN